MSREIGSGISKDSGVLMIGRALGFLISVGVPMVLVRVLSVSQYGEYRQMMLIITTAAIILPLSMPSSLYYFIPRLPDTCGVYISRTFAVGLMTSLSFFFIMLVFREHLSKILNIEMNTSLGLSVALVAGLMALSVIIEDVLIASKRVGLSAKVTVSTRLLRAAAIITGAYFFGITGIMYGLVIYFLFRVIVSWLYLRSVHGVDLCVLQLAQSGPQFRYVLPLACGTLLATLVSVFDKFVVSSALGSEQFSLYAIGCYEIPLMSIIFASIGDVILPRIVTLSANGDKEGVVRLWHKSIEKSFIIGIPIFMFCFVFSDILITSLFTAAYANASPIFRIGVFAILLECTRYGAITRAFGKTQLSFVAAFAAALFIIPASLYIVGPFGAIGVVSVSVLAQCIKVTGELLFSKSLLSLRWSNILPFKVPLLSAGIAFIVSILSIGLNCIIGKAGNLFAIVLTAIAFMSGYVFATNYFGLWTVGSLPIPEGLKSRLLIVLRA